MLITDRFIVINYPKTGSTFVRTIIKQLHDNLRNGRSSNSFEMKELFLPNIKVAGINSCVGIDQHGTVEQIPDQYKEQLPCLSVVRNPFDRTVSLYNFRAWKRRYDAIIDDVKGNFPEYPDLSFRRYLELECMYDPKFRVGSDLLSYDIGQNTFLFVQMFAKNVRKTLESINELYICENKIKKDLPSITFLKTESLNTDLFIFLRANGFKECEIDFIINTKKIYPNQPDQQRRVDNDDWHSYYDKDLFEVMRKKDSLILNLFPEYDSF
jgi:hypothetical protein